MMLESTVALFVLASASGVGPADIPLPPARYDYENGNMVVMHSSLSELQSRFCKSPYAYGCTVALANGGCGIVVPHREAVGSVMYDRIYRHEQGHCNGWPSHHPR